MKDEAFDVMVPVKIGDRTVWMKIGAVFPAREGSNYTFKMSLLTLPVGQQGPLDCFLYPMGTKRAKMQES